MSNLSQALELAAALPSGHRWNQIWEIATKLERPEIEQLDAALASWPDDLRVARTADVIDEPRSALLLARRLELAQGVIERAHIERLYASQLVRRLRSLALFSLDTKLDAIEAVAGHDVLPELVELQLGTADLDAASAIIADSQLPIRILTFEGGSATDQGLRSLSAGRGLQRVEHLQYHDVNVEDDGVAVLAESARWAQLVHLRISYAGLGRAGAIALANSPHLRRLRTLDLRLTHVGADGIAALASSDVARTLSELYLDEAELGARGVRVLATGWAGGRLRVLGLGHNRSSSMLSPDWQVGPDATRSLANAGWTTELVRLDMAGNAIGDAGAHALAYSQCFPALRELDLSMNDISDVGIEAIVAGQLLRQLDVLRLEHTTLSEVALDTLWDACERHQVRLVTSW